jgi:hypothetical protein
LQGIEQLMHLNFGELDGGSPIEHVRKGIETIAERYDALGTA